MDNQIKILRLKDGEDIISSCSYVNSENVVELHNPMTLFYKQLDGKSVVFMTPWLPVELIKINAARIFAHEVLTLIEPKDSLIQYYNKTVIQTNDALAESASEIDEALEANMFDEFGDDDDESQPEEQLQTFNTNTRIIH
jgi:hypothetical protein